MNGIYHRQTGSGPNCCIARRKQVTRGLNCWKKKRPKQRQRRCCRCILHQIPKMQKVSNHTLQLCSLFGHTDQFSAYYAALFSESIDSILAAWKLCGWLSSLDCEIQIERVPVGIMKLRRIKLVHRSCLFVVLVLQELIVNVLPGVTVRSRSTGYRRKSGFRDLPHCPAFRCLNLKSDLPASQILPLLFPTAKWFINGAHEAPTISNNESSYLINSISGFVP